MDLFFASTAREVAQLEDEIAQDTTPPSGITIELLISRRFATFGKFAWTAVAKFDACSPLCNLQPIDVSAIGETEAFRHLELGDSAIVALVSKN